MEGAVTSGEETADLVLASLAGDRR